MFPYSDTGRSRLYYTIGITYIDVDGVGQKSIDHYFISAFKTVNSKPQGELPPNNITSKIF